MNAVFIIPTGIGCSIGGHAGDATPAAKMIARCCDKLILHPNVVNASDINEMPSNALYVEGSILDRFLAGQIELQEVASNKILLAVNAPIKAETMNALNAARATIGLRADIVELHTPLKMYGEVINGQAVGRAEGVEELIQQVRGHTFDALAVATPIDVTPGAALEYFRGDGLQVNPWGGIEAQVSRQIATALDKPVAHAPVESDTTKGDNALMGILYDTVVDPRMAAEVCSSCYIHCVFKGLSHAPRIGRGISASSVACLVTPTGCIGPAHRACFAADIPVVAVKENKTATHDYDERITYVENYWEAAGVLLCIASGVDPESTRNKEDVDARQ